MIISNFGFVGEWERGTQSTFLKKRFCTPKNFEKGWDKFGFIGEGERSLF